MSWLVQDKTRDRTRYIFAGRARYVPENDNDDHGLDGREDYSVEMVAAPAGELALLAADGLTPIAAVDIGAYTETGTLNFYVANVGGEDVTVASAAIDDPAFTLTPNIGGTLLAPGAEVLMTAQIVSTEDLIGFFAADGITPLDQVIPLYFGALLSGASADLTLVIENLSATETVVIDSFGVSGGLFSVLTPPADLVLGPGETTTAVIRYAVP